MAVTVKAATVDSEMPKIEKDNPLLEEAVHQTSKLSYRALSERLFTAWFKGFFYNQIWEDPRVDMEALELNTESRVFTISSAGCNVLNYLVREPAVIMAVDFNPNHIYLTRLKLTALQALPTYEDFFTFFGCANCARNRENYYNYICGRLDAATRYFWEGGSWLRMQFRGPRINYFTKNFYDYARLGYFIRFIHGLAKLAKGDPKELLLAQTPEEQQRVFEEYVSPWFDHWVVQMVGRLPFLLFGIGIPPRQLEHLKRESNGQILEVYRERLRKLACDHPVSDNYFSWQAFGRQYDLEQRSALPEYLKEENYEIIKRAAVNVETEINSVHAVLGRMAENSLDRFVFLDAQDWMKPDQIEALWREIDRVGKPGTRIIFRTASSQSPVEEALSPETRGRFVYLRELGVQLLSKDRAAIYGGFHIYVKPS